MSNTITLPARYWLPGILITVVALPLLVYVGNPAIALLAASFLSVTVNQTIIPHADEVGKYALQAAIVLLGLKLDLGYVIQLSANFALTISSYVVITIIVGLVIGKILATEKKSSILVSSGTAICGGTAIACLSPTIRARPEQTAVVMALVFLLNAVALFVFPIVGEYFAMTQTQFGTWAALAIHDTSSVMATASIYGEEATAVATTLKLCRTLWLIPLVLLFSLLEKSPEAKLRLPVFILLFMLASVAGSTLSLSSTIPHYAGAASKILLVIALFCIGLEINRTTLKNFRGKVLVQGLLLWAIVVPVTLLISLNIA